MARTIELIRVAGLMLVLAVLGLQPVHAEKDALVGTQSSAVPLADVLALAQPYPNLRQEIRLARIAASGGATPTCSARQLGPEWLALKGQNVGPYRCRIGTRALDITTRVVFFDRARHKLATDAPNLHQRAATMTQSRLVWRWH